MLTTEAEIDAASPLDVATSHKLLLAEKAIWEKRTEMHEQRCSGLEQMMHELVDTIKSILLRQKAELNRIARISAEVVEAVAKRAREMEEA